MRVLSHRGLTLHEVVLLVIVIAALAAILLPSLGAVRGMDDEEASANNLRQLGAMHRNYAKDWDGRQWTVTPDDLSKILSAYQTDYRGWRHLIPPVSLGRDCSGQEHITSLHALIVPFWYPPNCSLGNFRAWNTRPFNVYANGRVYDPLFWAPRDPVPVDNPSIQQWWAEPCEFPGRPTWEGGRVPFFFPTYCMSMAAQVSPEVFRGPRDGGTQRALDLPLGHKTPNLDQARYPDLKTHMIEHKWLNPVNDEEIARDVRAFFNHSDMAENMTVFLDGAVRKLPNIEVLVSNDIVVRGGADPLWVNDDPDCFQSGGYFESYAKKPALLETFGLIDQVSSHHVFTANGILGRDTIFSGGD